MNLRVRAEEERDEAKRQSERAGKILRHARVSVDFFAMNVRSAKAEEIRTGNTGTILFQLAVSYAKTSASLAQDTELPFADRAELAEQYAESGVKLLECARQQGFFDPEKPANRALLKTDPNLASFRFRSDFKLLVNQIGMK